MGIKLGEICRFQSGGTPAKGKAEYFNGDIPWITTTALSGGKINESDAVDWITEKAIKESAAKIVPAFSIMVGTRVGVGKVAINTVDMSTSQDIISLIGIDETVWSKDFLCVFLQGKSAYLNSQARGATIKGIKIDVLTALELPAISLEEQQHISAVVDSTKHIISSRQYELQKLDDLIKARFVEMFGDKSKYRIEPLNDNVEEMFIGPFGSALKNEYFVDEDDSYCMVYEQKHAIQKTMDLPTRYVDEKKYNELKRFTVLGGDIIVSCRGTIGEIYSIPEDAPMGIMHPSIMKIRLKKEKYCNLFFVLMLEQYMQDSISKAKGSGVKMAVTATELGKELFVVPNIEEQMVFERFVKQLDKSKVAVQAALDKAQLLFDSLMQKYFG